MKFPGLTLRVDLLGTLVRIKILGQTISTDAIFYLINENDDNIGNSLRFVVMNQILIVIIVTL